MESMISRTPEALLFYTCADPYTPDVDNRPLRKLYENDLILREMCVGLSEIFPTSPVPVMEEPTWIHDGPYYVTHLAGWEGLVYGSVDPTIPQYKMRGIGGTLQENRVLGTLECNRAALVGWLWDNKLIEQYSSVVGKFFDEYTPFYYEAENRILFTHLAADLELERLILLAFANGPQSSWWDHSSCRDIETAACSGFRPFADWEKESINEGWMLYTVEEFCRKCENGLFSDWDGSGYFGYQHGVTRIEARPSKAVLFGTKFDPTPWGGGFPYVVWYNK